MQTPHDARIKHLLPGSDEISGQQKLFLSVSLSTLRPGTGMMFCAPLTTTHSVVSEMRADPKGHPKVLCSGDYILAAITISSKE